jgi:hypothetical protein
MASKKMTNNQKSDTMAADTQYQPRVVVVEDAKIKEILQKRNEVVLKGRELSDKIERLEQERQKCGLELEKLKDIITPFVKKHTDSLLQNPFEDVQMVSLVKGKIEIKIIDQAEEWKAKYVAARKK